MAERVLHDVAAGITEQVGNLARKEISLTWGVNDEITKLGDTVSTIETVLLDAEAKQDDSEAVKSWLRRLRDYIYDAEDLLDEISTESLRREVRARDKICIDLNRSFFFFFFYCYFFIKQKINSQSQLII